MLSVYSLRFQIDIQMIIIYTYYIYYFKLVILMFKYKNRIIMVIVSVLLCTIIASSIAGCSCSGEMDPTDYSMVTNPISTQNTEEDATNPTEELVDNPINFDELYKLNPDLYAWIRIPNTAIDYPVAQSSNSDDNYYLHHNYLGNYEFAGTIYSQRHNSKYFVERVTVLYGHNMLNGSMFADLHKFSDEEFFEENEYIYIYTKGHILTYRIFAAYEYDDRHIMNSFDFSDDEVYETYLNDCLHPHSTNSVVRDDVELTVDSRIITLSTCTNYNSSLRYLVQGVLINDQLTK